MGKALVSIKWEKFKDCFCCGRNEPIRFHVDNKPYCDKCMERYRQQQAKNKI